MPLFFIISSRNVAHSLVRFLIRKEGRSFVVAQHISFFFFVCSRCLSSESFHQHIPYLQQSEQYYFIFFPRSRPRLERSHQEKGISGSGSNSSLASSAASPDGVGTAAAAADGGAGDNTAVADMEASATCLPPKFTLTASECQLVRELFAWLVEPCLAFLRREVSEMVRSSYGRGGGSRGSGGGGAGPQPLTHATV